MPPGSEYGLGFDRRQHADRASGGPPPPDHASTRERGLMLLSTVLLVDAAMETLLSGSPVRWWVAGPIGIFFGGSAVLWWLSPDAWYRIPWRTKAAAPFLLLLGVLAGTIWLPGGLEDGMVLLGRSTSDVLCVIAAAAVTLSGLPLARLEAFRPVGRWFVVVVTGYAVAAFLWAIPTGVSYPALFRGGSLWAVLPFWLQGAFLGGVVLIPAALMLAALERLLGRRPRRRYPEAIRWIRKVERSGRSRHTDAGTVLFRGAVLAAGAVATFAALGSPDARVAGDTDGPPTEQPTRAFDRDGD